MNYSTQTGFWGRKQRAATVRKRPCVTRSLTVAARPIPRLTSSFPLIDNRLHIFGKQIALDFDMVKRRFVCGNDFCLNAVRGKMKTKLLSAPPGNMDTEMGAD